MDTNLAHRLQRRHTIIDTRQRERRLRSMSPERGPRRDTLPGVELRVDVGELLRPSRLPTDKFRMIQGLVNTQVDKLNTQTQRIVDLEREVSSGEKTIQRLNGRLLEQKRTIEAFKQRLSSAASSPATSTTSVSTKEADELRQRMGDYERRHEEDETALKISSSIISRKSTEYDRLKEKHRDLKSSLADRDARMQALNDHLFNLTTAGPDQLVNVATGIAVELARERKAQETLGFVRQLQADLEQKDKWVDFHSRANEELLNKFDNEVKARKAAEAKSAEARKLADDQARLISKLMAKNQELTANHCG